MQQDEETIAKLSCWGFQRTYDREAIIRVRRLRSLFCLHGTANDIVLFDVSFEVYPGHGLKDVKSFGMENIFFYYKQQ